MQEKNAGFILTDLDEDNHFNYSRVFEFIRRMLLNWLLTIDH